MDDRIGVVEAVLAKFENARLIERTGEMRWGDLQPILLRSSDVHCLQLTPTRWATLDKLRDRIY